MIELRNILHVSEPIRKKVFEWRNREEIRQWMNSPDEVSYLEHEGWLGNLKNASKKVFVIYTGKRPVGIIQLSDINHLHKTADVGLYVIEQRKGYGKAAVEILMREFFSMMKFQKLTANVHGGNKRSIMFFQKCGMRLEGCQVDQILSIDGSRRNLLWFGIAKDEWEFLGRAK